MGQNPSKPVDLPKIFPKNPSSFNNSNFISRSEESDEDKTRIAFVFRIPDTERYDHYLSIIDINDFKMLGFVCSFYYLKNGKFHFNQEFTIKCGTGQCLESNFIKNRFIPSADSSPHQAIAQIFDHLKIPRKTLFTKNYSIEEICERVARDDLEIYYYNLFTCDDQIIFNLIEWMKEEYNKRFDDFRNGVIKECPQFTRIFKIVGILVSSCGITNKFFREHFLYLLENCKTLLRYCNYRRFQRTVKKSHVVVRRTIIEKSVPRKKVPMEKFEREYLPFLIVQDGEKFFTIKDETYEVEKLSEEPRDYDLQRVTQISSFPQGITLEDVKYARSTILQKHTAIERKLIKVEAMKKLDALKTDHLIILIPYKKID